MCTKANPNKGLFTVLGYKYEIPLCEVVCCDMEKPDWDKMVNQAVTNPLQMAVLTKQLEFKVRDLTTEMAGLSKTVAMKAKKVG
jgi:hypothetical protein